jgi:hypothetical protein
LWGVLIVLLGTLSGCQWVFGDYEVADDSNVPVKEQICHAESTYYCQGRQLFLCVEAGGTWTELITCAPNQICDAAQGECTDVPGSTGTSSTTGASAIGENPEDG